MEETKTGTYSTFTRVYIFWYQIRNHRSSLTINTTSIYRWAWDVFERNRFRRILIFNATKPERFNQCPCVLFWTVSRNLKVCTLNLNLETKLSQQSLSLDFKKSTLTTYTRISNLNFGPLWRNIFKFGVSRCTQIH